MTYIKTTWRNDLPPAINASNLNKMEAGIFEAHTHIVSVGTDHGYIDQDVQQSAAPLFAGVVISDGGTIGQAAGPLLTFDDGNNLLGITGCQVGIGTSSPEYPLDIAGNYININNSGWTGVRFEESGNLRGSIVSQSGDNTFHVQSQSNALLLNETSAQNVRMVGGGGTVSIGTAVATGKLNVDGDIDFLSSISGNPNVRITSNQNSSSGGGISFTLNSGSPADNDSLGDISFRGKNSVGADTLYSWITGSSRDVTSGDESGEMTFTIRHDDGLSELLILSGYKGSVGEGEVIINEGGDDIDFRVEGAGQENALFVQGSDGLVGIGTNSPGAPLNINAPASGGSPWIGQLYIQPGAADKAGAISLQGTRTGQNRVWTLLGGSGSTNSHFRIFDSTAGEDRLNINSVGNVGIGTVTPSTFGGFDASAMKVFNLSGATDQAFFGVSGDIASLEMYDTAGGANDKWMSYRVDGGIAKFGSLRDDGSDWIADDILVMDMGTGKVGIGTDSPIEQLHVLNNQDARTVIEIENTNDHVNAWAGFKITGQNSETFIMNHADARTGTRFGLTLGGWTEILAGFGETVDFKGLIIGVESSEPIVFGTNDTEKMRITAGGEVGIGTNNPQQLLHIFESSGATNAGMEIESQSGNAILFLTADTDTKIPYIALRDRDAPDTNIGVILIDRATPIVTGAVQNDFVMYTQSGSNQKLHLGTENIARLTVDKDGSVGVGTTDALTIASWAGNSANQNFNVVSAASKARLISQGVTGATLDLVDTGGGADDKWIELLMDAGIAKFFAINDDGTIRVDNVIVMDHATGRVGFGTATPQTQIHALNNQDSNTEIEVENTNDHASAWAGFKITGQNSQTYIANHPVSRNATRYGLSLGGWTEILTGYAETADFKGLIIGVESPEPIVFGTNDVERMRITEAGNIGIGTVSPLNIASWTGTDHKTLNLVGANHAMLAVQGGDGASLDLVDTGGESNKKWMQLKMDANICKFGSILDDGSAFSNQYILSMGHLTGNIGMRTAAPRGTLEIQTDGQGTGTNTDDQLMIAGGLSDEMELKIGVNNAGVYSYIQSTKDGVAHDDLLLQPLGGNVGIGTDSPDSRLHVVGSAFPVLKIERTTSTTTGFSSGFTLDTITSGNMAETFGGSMFFRYEDATSGLLPAGRLGIVREDADKKVSMTFSVNDGTQDVGNNNLPERMRIDSSGNVGIGTNNPGSTGAAKLEVKGTDGNLAGPHMQFVTDGDIYPKLQILPWANDNINISFDAYFDGAFKSSDAGSNFMITKGIQPTSASSDNLSFLYDNGIAQGGAVTWNVGLVLDGLTGNVGIADVAPTAKLDINSDILRLRTPKTPASSGAAGNQGDMAWDADYFYICTSTNNWERVAIATW